MKEFIFRMYIKTKQKQEFEVGSIKIKAADYDTASREFSRIEKPFHTFALVDSK